MSSKYLGPLLLVGLLAATLIFIVGRFSNFDNTIIPVWGDRDLWRALMAMDGLPSFGAETNTGTRTAGGGFYQLLALAFMFEPSLYAAQLLQEIMFIAAIAIIGSAFMREVSPLAGALVAAALTGSGILMQSMVCGIRAM